jgi:hypothetical protein
MKCRRKSCVLEERVKGLCGMHYQRDLRRRARLSKRMKGHPFRGNGGGQVKLEPAPELKQDDSPRLFEKFGKKRVFILELREVFE